MFDIGFTELLLVGVVALVVVGPDRLPQLIRTTLSYVRQIKSGFAHVRDEVERELDLHKLQDEIIDSKNDLKDAVGYDEFNDSLDDLKKTSEELREIASDGYEHAEQFIEDHVDDAEIESDLEHLVTVSQRPLPQPDSEAETGVEQTTEKKPSTQTKKSSSKTA